MLNASVRTWQGRLLVAGAISLLLHVLAAIVAGHAGRPAAQAAPERLVLTLEPVRHAGPGKPDNARPSPARPHVPVPNAPATRAAPPAAAPVRAAAPSPAVPDTTLPGLASGPDDADDAGGMPGRYRVRMPPPASLTYSVNSNRAHGTGSAAHIVWQNDGDHYTLQIDGPLGTLTSSGHGGDAGIVPLEAHEQRAGSEAITRFDEASGNIVFSTSQRSYPINMGSQDQASVLMQLAGMGLAEPEQFSGRIDIFVAGADDAGIARYQVIGKEEVDSGVGTVQAWHLAQLVAPGKRRLEIWLAPERGWYPVQLRVTDPDGTITTQVLQSIGQPQPAA